MKYQRQSIKTNEQGIVAIIVTLVLMIIITLVVLGFAQISRREQRKALDRQLSTQAFYAAESGVNDAVAAINSGTFFTNKTTCDNTGTPFDGLNVLDPPNNIISYTCLLINQSPDSIVLNPTTKKAVSADMRFSDSGGVGASATSISIEWTTGSSNLYPNFPPLASWSGGTSLLRLAATDLSTNQYHRDDLNNNTFTTFLYPSDGSGAAGSDTVAFTPTGTDIKAQGSIVKATCSVGPPQSCTATVTFISTPVSHIFFRVGAIYSDTTITIRANNGLTPLSITGTQAVVDATGKAQDVLRRIQVRLPLRPSTDVPPYSVQAVKGICKQLATDLISHFTTYSLFGGCTYP